MYKNILIIGFGNMGKSHLKSFLISKKKYKIHIYDLKSVVDREIKNFSNKINFLSKFPKKKNYDLAILATSSKVRYKLLMKLLNYNKIKNIMDYKGKIKFDTVKPNGSLRKLTDIRRFVKIGIKHKIDNIREG